MNNFFCSDIYLTRNWKKNIKLSKAEDRSSGENNNNNTVTPDKVINIKTRTGEGSVYIVELERLKRQSGSAL